MWHRQELANVRVAAAFLSKTELKFDLVSAVNELAAQIKLEFNFEREARVMDSIAEHKGDCSKLQTVLSFLSAAYDWMTFT